MESEKTVAADKGDEARYPGTPRWVKLSAVFLALLILLAAILMLAGGDHGPGRHRAGQESTSR